MLHRTPSASKHCRDSAASVCAKLQGLDQSAASIFAKLQGLVLHAACWAASIFAKLQGLILHVACLAASIFACCMFGCKYFCMLHVGLQVFLHAACWAASIFAKLQGLISVYLWRSFVREPGNW